MIYTPMTKRAMQIAYDAHHGHYTKDGVPYIFHPAHLAEQMTDEITATAALLHDVAEDTTTTLRDLRVLFPPEVTEALALLTHDKDLSYLKYIAALKDNPVARTVKIADLRHNLDESRLDKTDSVTDKRRAKYLQALAILED